MKTDIIKNNCRIKLTNDLLAQALTADVTIDADYVNERLVAMGHNFTRHTVGSAFPRLCPMYFTRVKPGHYKISRESIVALSKSSRTRKNVNASDILTVIKMGDTFTIATLDEKIDGLGKNLCTKILPRLVNALKREGHFSVINGLDKDRNTYMRADPATRGGKFVVTEFTKLMKIM